MNLSLFIALVWLHFLADFVLQSDAMATRKSSSNPWLFRHVAVYSAVMLLVGPGFALVNGVLHFAADFISSRVAKRMWEQGRRRQFFLTIGVDQALHLTALGASSALPLLRW